MDGNIYRKDCTDGNCEECNSFEESSPECVFQCPTIFDDSRVYKWKEFEDYNLENSMPIRELRLQSGSGTVFKRKFKEKLRRYKKHFYLYKYLDFCRKFDIATLKRNWLLIYSDYSSQVVFESQDKLNSQGHGVAVLSCWVVLHSPEIICYTDENGNEASSVYYQCDHVRVVSPARGKGKDQDWYLHSKVFDFLINRYKDKIPDLVNGKIILWTDGAVTQYKCRQIFFLCS